MNISSFSTEIQGCIKQMFKIREQTGEPGYEMCQMLLEYAAEENSEELFGLGYYYFAEHYMYQSDAEKVLYCLTEGTKYFRRAGMYDYLAKAYNLMGAVAETQNNRVVALDYYYSCIQCAEEYGYIYEKAMAESNIANILFYMKQYREALNMNQSSVRHFKKAEWTSYSNWNIALSWARSGQCHLELQEPEKAMDTYRRIVELSERHKECRYPELNITILYACCCYALGRETSEGVEKILRYMDKEISLIENADSIMDMARLLGRLGDYDKMCRFLRLLKRKGLEEHLALLLEIYPHWNRCLLAAGRMPDYIKYAKLYFQLYEGYQNENHRAAVRIVELRDRLRNIEKEQDRILAYHQELQLIAQQDPMTGLANRTYLDEYLVHRFEEAYKNKTLLGVELLDIDYFKKYNDTYGHLEGDRCIEAVAAILKEMSSEHIFCARYGGDEFMVIYTGMEEKEIAETARGIQHQVRMLRIPHKASLCGEFVTVSQGIFCHVPSAGNKEWDFNSMADITLYEVKRAGRNHFKVCTEFHDLGAL